MTPRIYKSFNTKVQCGRSLDAVVEALRQCQQTRDKQNINQEIMIYVKKENIDLGQHPKLLVKFKAIRRDKTAPDYTYLCTLPTNEVVRVHVVAPVRIHCARLYKRNDSWFCSVVYSVKAPAVCVDYNKCVGIDLGYDPYLILSDATSYSLPDYIKKNFKRINKLHSEFRKTQSQDVKLEIRKLRTKVRRQFIAFHVELVKQLFSKYDILYIEKPLTQFVQPKPQTYGLYWCAFVKTAIRYALEHGKLICVVQPTGNSKKCCFCNGPLKPIVKGSAKFVCQKCQLIIDKNENAATLTLKKK